MIHCSNCGKEYEDNVNFCSECGKNLTNITYNSEREFHSNYTGLGVSGFVLGVLSLCISWIPLINRYVYIISILIIMPLSILAIIFGSISFWSRFRDKAGLVGFITGVISLIIGIIIFIIQLTPRYI